MAGGEIRRKERFPICSGCERDSLGLYPVFGNAGVAQLAEHQPSKLRVAGSIPVSRSIVSDDIGLSFDLFGWPVVFDGQVFCSF